MRPPPRRRKTDQISLEGPTPRSESASGPRRTPPPPSSTRHSSPSMPLKPAIADAAATSSSALALAGKFARQTPPAPRTAECHTHITQRTLTHARTRTKTYGREATHARTVGKCANGRTDRAHTHQTEASARNNKSARCHVRIQTAHRRALDARLALMAQAARAARHPPTREQWMHGSMPEVTRGIHNTTNRRQRRAPATHQPAHRLPPPLPPSRVVAGSR